MNTTGCVVVPPPVPQESPPAVPLPVSEQVQAETDEHNEDYLSALRYWKEAEQILHSKISTISKHLREKSEYHLLSAIDHFEHKESRKASFELILALQYDPQNAVALDYLHNRFKATQHIEYTVIEGDTFENIANNIYGSFFDSYLVENFSGLADEQELQAGLKLRLPLKYSFMSQALLDYKKNILEARRLYHNKNYAELTPLARQILKDNPGDSEASFLVNRSLLRQAEDLRKFGNFDQAIILYSQIDPNFRDTSHDIRETNQQKIIEQQRLDLVDTKVLLNQGTNLFNQGKYLESIEVLIKIDDDLPQVRKLITKAIKQTRSKANDHYKAGVKYFIEDNLSDAIVEWEQALRYNPDHKKATTDMEKAYKLLQKINKIN